MGSVLPVHSSNTLIGSAVGSSMAKVRAHVFLSQLLVLSGIATNTSIKDRLRRCKI